NLKNYQNPNWAIRPYYYIKESEVNIRLAGKWKKNWLLCFRGITSKSLERSAIFTLLPKVGLSNSCPAFYFENTNSRLISSFLAGANSLVFDYVTRQKISGANFNFFIVNQLPFLSPSAFNTADQ